MPFGFENSSLSGTLTIGADRTLALTGITLGFLQADPSLAPLVIKADIVFTGSNPIPEPGAATAMAAGLLVVGAAVKRRTS